MKWLILVLVMLSMATPLYAIDTYLVANRYCFDANCTAYLTYDNTTETILLSKAMAFGEGGNATNKLEITNWSFAVDPEAQEMVNLATVIGIIAIMAFILYIAKDMMQKPIGQYEGNIAKYLNTKNIGVFFYLLSSWGVVAITGFLMIAATGMSYYPLLRSMFIGSVYIVMAFNIIYTVTYFIFVVKGKFSDIAKEARRR